LLQKNIFLRNIKNLPLYVCTLLDIVFVTQFQGNGFFNQQKTIFVLEGLHVINIRK